MRVKRRQTRAIGDSKPPWQVLGVFFLLGGVCGIAVAKPNIALIMADDMGYECLGKKKNN